MSDKERQMVGREDCCSDESVKQCSSIGYEGATILILVLLMVLFSKKKANCEQVFEICEDEYAVPIQGIAIPEGSTIGGTTSVTILDCEPIVELCKNTIKANVTYWVDKEFTVTTPEGREIPLEWGFRRNAVVTFCECRPNDLLGPKPNPFEVLRCQVLSTCVSDKVILHPSSAPDATDATIDDLLKFRVLLKVVVDRRLCCPDTHVAKVKFA